MISVFSWVVSFDAHNKGTLLTEFQCMKNFTSTTAQGAWLKQRKLRVTKKNCPQGHTAEAPDGRPELACLCYETALLIASAHAQ